MVFNQHYPHGKRWMFQFISVIVIVLLQHQMKCNLTQQCEDAINRFCSNVSIPTETTCLTKDCVVTASGILQAMDHSVNPCTDFYQFTCGNYNRRNPVPNNEQRESVHIQHANYYDRLLKDLSERTDTLGEPDIVIRAQKAYHVCLNSSYHKDKEHVAFRKFINEILGGWPLAQGSRWKQKIPLEELIGKVQRYGFSLKFGKIIVMPHPYNMTENYLWLKEETTNGLGMVSSFFIGPRITPAAKIVLEAIMKVLRKRKTARFSVNEWGEASRVPFVFHQYSTIHSRELRAWIERTEKMTVKKLNHLTFAEFDWLKLLNAKFDGIYTFVGNETIFAYPKFIDEISLFLKHVKPRALINFIIWEVIAQMIIRGILPVIQEEILSKSKVEISSSRSTWCLIWIQEAYRFAVARLYIKKHMDLNGKSKANEMVQQIRDAYRTMINDSQWLDEKSKTQALLKFDLMRQFIGAPDFIFDDQEIENYYNYISSVNPIHVDNFLDARKNKSIKTMKEYFGPPIDLPWDVNPLDSNAYYDRDTNSFWLPSGILQQPFFDATRPASVNFGMLGAVIGHEIGHGFDADGGEVDGYGFRNPWLTRNNSEEYNEKVNCFRKQYSDYCPEDILDDDSELACVNHFTLNDNIADNIGLQASLKAYRNWVRQYGQEKHLPGLQEFTLEQIFFISYGYIWCDNVAMEHWKDIYEKATHAPARYRVIGVVSNMKEFADAFACSSGAMNRQVNRCKFW